MKKFIKVVVVLHNLDILCRFFVSGTGDVFLGVRSDKAQKDT